MADAAPPPEAPTAAPPPANTSPWYSDWTKPDGTLNHASLDRLPEDVRWVKEPFSKYKTADDLARGFANLTTAVGKKGLIPLEANASKEAVAERKALLDGISGVPKTGKEYGLTRPADVPESAWDGAYIEKVQDWAQKNSVGPGAMKELLSGVVAPQIKGQTAKAETDRSTFLREEDEKFNTQIALDAIPREKADALAERAAVALGFNMEDPAQAGLLKYSAVKLAMLRHAIATGEDSYVAGEGAKGEGGDAMALAQDAVHNAANPLNAPLMDPRHPQHKMAKEKVDQWFKLAAAKMQKAGR
jgi:hypothetical protein